MRLVAASCVVCVVLAAAPAFGQSASRLIFAQDKPLTVSVDGDAKCASATVVLVNSGPGLSALDFSAVSEKADAPAITVTPTAGSAIPAHSAKPIELSFTSTASLKGFDGHLIASTEGAAAERDLKIDAKNTLPFSVNLIIFASLIVAVALTALRAWRLKSRLGYLLSAPNWDFSKSWASTFTVVGALLGTILSSLVLPETPERFSKATLAGMNLVFGVAILLAPLIFALSQTGRYVKKDASTSELQPQGTVAGYLLAAALTLTGVLGQLATVFFLLDEIEAKGSLPDAALVFIILLLLFAALGVLLHAWNTMGWTAANATKPPDVVTTAKTDLAEVPASAFTPSLL